MIDPEISHAANEARELKDSAAFQSVMDEIVTNATKLFLDANCDTTTLSKAHEGVRAVQHVMDAIQSRLTAETMAKKRDQHRE